MYKENDIVYTWDYNYRNQVITVSECTVVHITDMRNGAHYVGVLRVGEPDPNYPWNIKETVYYHPHKIFTSKDAAMLDIYRSIRFIKEKFPKNPELRTKSAKMIEIYKAYLEERLEELEGLSL